MTHYAGLCIDGPMDGQRVACATSKLQVQERAPAPVAPVKDADVLKIADIETIWYHWHEPGLWLLEGVGPETATTHMAEKIGLAALASRYEQIVAREKDNTRER